MLGLSCLDLSYQILYINILQVMRTIESYLLWSIGIGSERIYTL